MNCKVPLSHDIAATWVLKMLLNPNHPSILWGGGCTAPRTRLCLWALKLQQKSHFQTLQLMWKVYSHIIAHLTPPLLVHGDTNSLSAVSTTIKINGMWPPLPPGHQMNSSLY